MTYHQTLIRKAASLARRRGFAVHVSDSRSSESSYLYIGRPSRQGGLKVLAQLRVSGHCRPGWARGGWLAIYSSGALYFDLRPRSRSYDRQRVERFLDRACGNEK